MDMPKEIKTARRCMWIAYALIPVGALLGLGPMIFFLIPVLLLQSLISLLPIYFVGSWKGWKMRNVARVFYALVLVVIPLVYVIAVLVTDAEVVMRSMNAYLAMLLIPFALSWASSLYAVVLMFREPGKQWFKVGA